MRAITDTNKRMFNKRYQVTFFLTWGITSQMTAGKMIQIRAISLVKYARIVVMARMILCFCDGLAVWIRSVKRKRLRVWKKTR